MVPRELVIPVATAVALLFVLVGAPVTGVAFYILVLAMIEWSERNDRRDGLYLIPPPF